MEFKTFGEWLRYRRLKLDISPFKMAEELGYKRVSAIYNFEYGVAPLPMTKWASMARVLELPLDQFLNIISRHAPQKVSEFRAIQTSALVEAAVSPSIEGKALAQPIHEGDGKNIRTYRLEEASQAIICKGRVPVAFYPTIDELWEKGDRVGLMEILQPKVFPAKTVVDQLKQVGTLGILEGESSHPLANAIKAAFLDALTGEEGYPRIHRVPEIYTLILNQGSNSLSIDIIDVILGTMGERPDARVYQLSRQAGVEVHSG